MRTSHPTHRRAMFRTSALGALTCLTLGSGLIALTSDSVTSVGNHLESSDYTEPPTAHDLQVAQGFGPDCSDDVYSDDTVLPMPLSSSTLVGGPLDLNNPAGFEYQNGFYCARNAGTETMRLSLEVLGDSVVESEVACDAAEGVAEGDETCGDTGELAPTVNVTVSGYGPDGSPCAFGINFDLGRFPTLVDVTRFLVDLEPGEECQMVFYFRYYGTPDQRVTVQSDAIDFDVRFLGSDPE